MTSLNIAYIQKDDTLNVSDEYNPNLPKMPLKTNDNKYLYKPFYEYKQPWRSTYYESQGITKHKENKSIQDLARLDDEYAHIQPLLNSALSQNAEVYTDLIRAQDYKLFYNGGAGLGTSSLFKGVRFTNNYNNNVDVKYSKYNYINQYNPAYVDSNGEPDTNAMRNTYRPCKKIGDKWYYCDLVNPEPLHTGLYCSPKNGFHSMPINRLRPNSDASFGVIFDEDSRIATKPFQEIVEVVTKVLPEVNVVGFKNKEEAFRFKDYLSKEVVNPITSTFVSGLVTVTANNGKVYLVPNMPN